MSPCYPEKALLIKTFRSRGISSVQDKGIEGSPQAHLSRACLPAWFSHSISGGQCLITFFSPVSTYILRTVSEFSLLVFYCKFKLLCYFSHTLHLKTYLVLWFKSLAIRKDVLKLINRWEIYGWF